MKRLFKSFRKGEGGFTLIELLVVIAILGIIAAVVVPNFGNFFGKGQTEACKIEDRMVTTVTIAYASEHGACPSSIDDLDAYFEDPEDIKGEYTFGGTYPNCTVTQDECPASAE
jgi:prepilin-type N-terminal cleavage/methylation domain-containing protein